MEKIGAGTWWLLAISTSVIWALFAFDFGASARIGAIALLVFAWLTRNATILNNWVNSVFAVDTSREEPVRRYYAATIRLLSEIKWLLYTVVMLLGAILHELWSR
jgi:hypothetical protein